MTTTLAKPSTPHQFGKRIDRKRQLVEPTAEKTSRTNRSMRRRENDTKSVRDFSLISSNLVDRGSCMKCPNRRRSWILCVWIVHHGRFRIALCRRACSERGDQTRWTKMTNSKSLTCPLILNEPPRTISFAK